MLTAPSQVLLGERRWLPLEITAQSFLNTTVIYCCHVTGEVPPSQAIFDLEKENKATGVAVEPSYFLGSLQGA